MYYSRQTSLQAPGGFEEVGRNLALFEQLFVGHSWTHIAKVIEQFDKQLSSNQNGDLLIRRCKNMNVEIRNMLITISKH